MHFLKGLRVWVVVTTLLVALAVLFGCHWLFEKQYREEPLITSLENMPGVNKVTIINRKETKQPQIIVALEEVSDLKETYILLQKEISRAFDTERLIIDIKDNASPQLEALWYRSHFAVYEALENGTFTNMEASLRTITKQAGIKNYKVQVDDKRLYLQFHQNGYYLYRVLNRPFFERTDVLEEY